MRPSWTGVPSRELMGMTVSNALHPTIKWRVFERPPRTFENGRRSIVVIPVHSYKNKSGIEVSFVMGVRSTVFSSEHAVKNRSGRAWRCENGRISKYVRPTHMDRNPCGRLVRSAIGEKSTVLRESHAERNPSDRDSTCEKGARLIEDNLLQPNIKFLEITVTDDSGDKSMFSNL